MLTSLLMFFNISFFQIRYVSVRFYTFSQHHHPCLHVIVMLRCGWKAFLACPECFFRVSEWALWGDERAFMAVWKGLFCKPDIGGHRTTVVRSVECQRVVLKQYFILYSAFFSQCLCYVCISVHLNVKGQKAVRVFVCVYLIILWAGRGAYVWLR